MRGLKILSLLLLVSGCVAHQHITVVTTPEHAACTLSNSSGSWSVDNTPGIVNVALPAFSGDLTVICKKGNEQNTAVVSMDDGFRYPSVVPVSVGKGEPLPIKVVK